MLPFRADGEVPNNSVSTFADIFELVDVAGDWINDCVGEMNISVKVISISSGLLI